MLSLSNCSVSKWILISLGKSNQLSILWFPRGCDLVHGIKLGDGKKRHEFQADHGFRKWFKTRCEIAGMKSICIETVMAYSTGISDHYFRPTIDELLNEYLKAVDYLTISQENKLISENQQMKIHNDQLLIQQQKQCQ